MQFSNFVCFYYFNSDGKQPDKARVNCPHCTKTYTDDSSVRRHIRATHVGHRFLCQYCDKNFQENHMLEAHIGYSHPAEFRNKQALAALQQQHAPQPIFMPVPQPKPQPGNLPCFMPPQYPNMPGLLSPPLLNMPGLSPTPHLDMLGFLSPPHANMPRFFSPPHQQPPNANPQSNDLQEVLDHLTGLSAQIECLTELLKQLVLALLAASQAGQNAQNPNPNDK